MRTFLGADLGGSKTHVLVADETGCVLGFGLSGPANHQSVGYDGMLLSLKQGLERATTSNGVGIENLAGAFFGIAGYDWPSEKPAMTAVIDRLGLSCPYDLGNDAILPIVAGARGGSGVGLISGTGCNCRGWDPEHRREGRVTGYGYYMGEFAGATEMVWRAMQLVANQWTRRGPDTVLSNIFIEHTGAKDLEDLIEGYTKEIYHVRPQAAPLIFRAAMQGDAVALDLIRWAGVELGEMAKAVIRQLKFEEREFDVVLAGSMFDGGPMLIDPLLETIRQLAPGARLVRLSVLPVVGAAILAMEQGGITVNQEMRLRLAESLPPMPAD